MSYRIVSRAWAIKGLSPAQKLVLVRLADMANDEGVCWPSYVSIARDVEIDVRSVRRIASTLEALGHVTRSPRFNSKGVQLSNWLTVLPPDDRRADSGLDVVAPPGPGSPPAPGPVSPAHPDRGVRATRTRESPPTRTGESPKSLLESSLNLQHAESVRAKRATPPIGGGLTHDNVARIVRAMSPFQISSALADRSFSTGAGPALCVVKAGSPEMESLRQALRSQNA